MDERIECWPDGSPVDDDLADLGVSFHYTVNANRYADAAQALIAIDAREVELLANPEGA